MLRSEALTAAGFAHGFSTRLGGVSVGPFASLNLARSVGDDAASVAENVRRFSLGLALRAPPVFEVSQVHGRAVVVVREGDEVAAVRPREADALVTASRGVAVGVRTADCVPILLADPASGAVAAVHAGWRGVVLEVLAAALTHFDEPARLIAAIGPHIRAFEVSEDIAAQLAQAAHGEPVVEARSPRPHVDLGRAVSAQLRQRGVRIIDDVGGCTLSEPARFYSHRRDAGVTGRHLSAIVAR